MVSVCTVLGTLFFLDSSSSPSLSSETTSQSAFGRVTLLVHSNWGSCLHTLFQYQKRARQLAHFRQVQRIRLQKDPEKALEQDIFWDEYNFGVRKLSFHRPWMACIIIKKQKDLSVLNIKTK